ncbi:MAG: hemin receptor [Acidobacteria bacterium]|nr:hemin receptor [Acidobacteriota bacterium]
MTFAQKQMIRDSYEQIRTFDEAVFLLFYGRMFELDPTIRPMFRHDMKEQAKKLIQTLDLVVDSLDRMEALKPRLAELGRSHAGYGVKPHHYETLAAALLWAFGQALSAGFPAEVRAAWRAVLAELSAEMIAAGEGAGAMEKKGAEE